MQGSSRTRVNKNDWTKYQLTLVLLRPYIYIRFQANIKVNEIPLKFITYYIG